MCMDNQKCKQRLLTREEMSKQIKTYRKLGDNRIGTYDLFASPNVERTSSHLPLGGSKAIRTAVNLTRISRWFCIDFRFNCRAFTHVKFAVDTAANAGSYWRLDGQCLLCHQGDTLLYTHSRYAIHTSSVFCIGSVLQWPHNLFCNALGQAENLVT